MTAINSTPTIRTTKIAMLSSLTPSPSPSPDCRETKAQRLLDFEGDSKSVEEPTRPGFPQPGSNNSNCIIHSSTNSSYNSQRLPNQNAAEKPTEDELVDSLSPAYPSPESPCILALIRPRAISLNSSTTPCCSGVSVYLASLLPSDIPPISANSIELLLINARLHPSSTLALTGCIIDALSHKFYRTWLNSLPCENNIPNSQAILLAAISISMKFMEDLAYPIKLFLRILENCEDHLADHYDPLSVQDISKAEIQILDDLDFNLYPLLSNNGLDYMLRQFKKSGFVLDYSVSATDNEKLKVQPLGRKPSKRRIVDVQ